MIALYLRHLVPVLAAVTLVATLVCASANAAVISVNFHATETVPQPVDPAPDQAAHEVAGSETAGFESAQNWNNVNLGDTGVQATETVFSSVNLVDGTGANSGATLAPSSTGTYFVGYVASRAVDEEEELDTSQPGYVGTDDSDDLYNSYLGLNTGDGVVLEIRGLGTEFTGPGYRVIIYSDSDRGRSTNFTPRTSVFTLKDTSDGVLASSLVEDDDPNTTAETDFGANDPTFNGTYVLSDGVNDSVEYSNYTILDNLTASDFNLEIDSPDGGRGAINGFQIVAIPEPASMVLLGLGGLVTLTGRRRKL
jgi:hypothetical protein